MSEHEQDVEIIDTKPVITIIQVTKEDTDKAIKSFDITEHVVNEWIGQEKSLVISSKETYKTAAKLWKVMKDTRLRVEKRRKDIVNPFNDHLKKINGFAKELGLKIKDPESSVKAKMTAWEFQLAAEKERQEQETTKMFVDVGFRIESGVAILGSQIHVMSMVFKMTPEEIEGLLDLGREEKEKMANDAAELARLKDLEKNQPKQHVESVKQAEASPIPPSSNESSSIPRPSNDDLKPNSGFDGEAPFNRPDYAVRTPMVDKAMEQSESTKPMDAITKPASEQGAEQVSESKFKKSEFADGFECARDIIIHEFRTSKEKRTRVDWVEWMKTINSAMPKS